jgi:hypothetical protein
MKKTLSILIIGVLILGGLGAVATVATTGEEIKQEKMTLSFSQLSIQEKDGSITLELDGANSILIKKDYYMVPTSLETFTFPFGTEIESIQCIPKNIHRQELTKELMISPEPVIVGTTVSNEKNEKCENPISVNVWYDYDIGCGLKGNERCIFVKVQTYPVQYYPSDNTIEWAENVEIDIKYKEPEQTTLSFDDDYSFIVLTPTDFSSELGALINHKISRGISTKLVTLDEIYGGTYFPVQGRDDQEKIKYFVKNAVENWNTNFVLLVGSNLKFPTRLSHVDDLTFISDLYYSDIYDETYNFLSWDSNENDIFGEYRTDEVDLYPDVFLGRIACINANEVTTCVNKIITYETNEAYAQDWFTNLVVIGGDTFPSKYGDDSGIDEGEYVNQAVIDIMEGFIPDRIWDSNGRLSGISPSGVTSIDNAINSGCGFVDFSGHGASWVYTTYRHNGTQQVLPTPTGRYRNSHAADLKNGDKLPIVVIGACSVGEFDSDPDCFAWSFVSNPDGGGIASFGATTYGSAYIGKWVTMGLIEGMTLNVFEAYKDGGAITFGEMWLKGINNYISPGMSETDYLTIEEWQPFGDPTLAIAGESLAPVKPDAPEGSTSGAADVEHTYTASTTDSDGDKLYYLFDWGDGKFSGWVGPYNSGQTAQASHTWKEKGDYEIRVKAKDDHGVQSEWSDPLPISMPKNKQLIDLPFFDFLERFPRLFPILRNIFGM